LGTLIMAAVGGAGLVLMRPLGASFSADLVRLMVLVLGGAGVYILVARLLGNEMLAMLLGRRRADAVGRVR